jgi:hypothetical protein
MSKPRLVAIFFWASETNIIEDKKKRKKKRKDEFNKRGEKVPCQ